jgi:hypothetical protein
MKEILSTEFAPFLPSSCPGRSLDDSKEIHSNGIFPIVTGQGIWLFSSGLIPSETMPFLAPTLQGLF